MNICGGNTSSLPPSLPTNWPESTDEEIDERPTRIINFGKEKGQDFWFRDNFVKTSKYEWFVVDCDL